MTVQILRKKFTVGQYHQMIESGILSDRDRPHGRGRETLPRAIHSTAKKIPGNVQMMMLIDDHNPTLGEVSSPLR